MLDKFQNKFQRTRIENSVEELVNAAQTSFVGDEMLVLNKNMHFFDDPKFSKILSETALNNHYKGMAWRLHVLLYASKLALTVSGDFIECGVFRGFKSYFLLSYLGELLASRKYYLMDTFEGIDENLSSGSPIKKSEHNKARLYDFIKHRFEEFSNVQIVRGSVPESTLNIDFESIAFLHLDMNSYQAELGALDKFWDLMPRGGVIVLDDFGLFSHKAQYVNESPWFQEKNQSILEFPTGQGLIIKT